MTPRENPTVRVTFLDQRTPGGAWLPSVRHDASRNRFEVIPVLTVFRVKHFRVGRATDTVSATDGSMGQWHLKTDAHRGETHCEGPRIDTARPHDANVTPGTLQPRPDALSHVLPNPAGDQCGRPRSVSAARTGSLLGRFANAPLMGNQGQARLARFVSTKARGQTVVLIAP